MCSSFLFLLTALFWLIKPLQLDSSSWVCPSFLLSYTTYIISQIYLILYLKTFLMNKHAALLSNYLFIHYSLNPLNYSCRFFTFSFLILCFSIHDISRSFFWNNKIKKTFDHLRVIVVIGKSLGRWHYYYYFFAWEANSFKSCFVPALMALQQTLQFDLRVYFELFF